MRARRFAVIIASALAVSACAQLSSPRTIPDADNNAAAPPEPTIEVPVVMEAAPLPPPMADPVPAPPEDLWARIRAGFQMPQAEHPRVTAEVDFFAKRPSYLERVTDRAEPYLHHIVEEIERRGLPMELALLPIVESAFQPFAYSPGRAAGIWQFIPSTGLHYGLKQTWWYDGRRDVIASTDAALTYLERLYGQFGDWNLALAAYNAGQGTVRGAISRNTRAGKPTDYWNLPLPNETRGYVPRLMALRTLIEQPEEYDLALRSLPNEPYLTVVETGTQLDLALAAEMAELDIQDIYRLNPGFNRWATDPEGPHRLVLPLDKADAFMAALEQLPEDKRVRWHRHQVRSGQTLSHIARDFRTTVNVIQQANGLRDHRIRVGAYLIVPVARENAAHYALSESQRLAQQQARGKGKRHVHQVRQGDTLWDLARSYGVSVSQITGWNGMAPKDTLRPGQQLVLWLPQDGVKPAGMNRAAPAPRLQAVNYTVRQGDSLYLIARKFNVTIEQLRQWNRLPAKGYLQPGQRLTVKVDVTGQQAGRI